MTIGEIRRAIGRFPSRADAEAALYELKAADFNIDKVSVVTKGVEPGDMSGADLVDDTDKQAEGGAKVGATAGAATGAVLGFIGGLGVLAIPGVGPAAEFGIVLANTLLGSGIGAAGGGLIGVLVGWGVPEERAKYYDKRIAEGDYVILVEGTESEILNAERILSRKGINDWDVYNIPGRSVAAR